MKFSIILPMYNEEGNLAPLLSRLDKTVSKYNHEIICINDGSKDKTAEVLEKLAKKYRLKVYSHETNLGIGAAIKTGINKANGDVIIMMESDLSQDPEQMPLLIKKMEEGYDLVIGSRFIDGSAIIKTDFFKKLISGVSNPTLKFLIGAKINDVTSGFRAIKRSKALKLNLKSDGFELLTEMLIKAVKKKYKIEEVPINIRKRYYGESKRHFTTTFAKTFVVVVKHKYFNN